ncbi:MAG: DUF4340 domain-containing protein [Ectothiorhodospiraceae bacterium]|nr:DUF4340 domain-containing protein [Ectothiorhodospiraceae bacterium]
MRRTQPRNRLPARRPAPDPTDPGPGRALRARAAANLLLLAVVGALLAVVLRQGERDAEPPEAGIAVSSLDPARITTIEVLRRSEPVARAERAGDGWRLVAPLAWPADPSVLDRLAAIAGARSSEGFRAAGNDLAQYGLAPPRLELRLQGQSFALGDVDPLGGRRYVLHAGQVHLLPDRYATIVGASAAAFVHPALIGPGADPVEIRLPGLHLRRAEASWRLDPEDPGVSADRVTELGERWRLARAVRTTTAPPGPPGNERVEVTLGGEPGIRLELDVLRTTHETLFVNRAIGVAFHLPRAGAERLLALPP